MGSVWQGITKNTQWMSVLRCNWWLLQRAKQLTTQKEAGNAAFRAGRLQEAYDLYSKALQIDPHNNSTNSKLYCNRATVGSKVSVAGCQWQVHSRFWLSLPFLQTQPRGKTSETRMKIKTHEQLKRTPV